MSSKGAKHFSFWRRGVGRLKAARLRGGRLVVFAVGWALVMPFCAAVSLVGNGWPADDHLIAAVLPFGVGGLVASIAAVYAAVMVSWHREPTARFATFFSLLTVFTLLFTALVFSLHYRLYYSEWHAAPFTVVWVMQTLFTGIGSLYLFAVNGPILLLPWGAAVAILAAVLFSSGWFSHQR